MTSYASRRRELQTRLEQFNSQAVYPLLAELGSRHTTGPLLPMGFDPSKPYHRLTTAMVPGVAVSNRDLAPFGPKAHKNFRVIPEAWHQHSDMMRFIAGEMLRGRTNFTLITNHSNIIDIALVAGALRLEIERWLSAMEFTQRCTLVISRGITTTQLYVREDDLFMPAVEAIQMFANVALSFPTTPTVRNKKFPDDLVRTSNELTKLELAEFLEPGGRLLAIAPSASRDIFYSERIHMQPLKAGTMQLMRGWVIPVAVNLDGDEPPACTILGPTFIETDDDCHAVMHEIAHECHRQTLVPHTYHEKPHALERALDRLRRD